MNDFVELHDKDVEKVLNVTKQIKFHLNLLEKHLKDGEFYKAQANKNTLDTLLVNLVTQGFMK